MPVPDALDLFVDTSDDRLQIDLASLVQPCVPPRPAESMRVLLSDGLLGG